MGGLQMSEELKIMQMDARDLARKIMTAQEHINAAVSRFNKLRHAKKQLDKKIANQIRKEKLNYSLRAPE